MELNFSEKQDYTIIAVKGKLDSNSSSDFDNQINELLNKGKNKLIFDFAQLDYISSAGLRVLLSIAKKLKTQDGKLGLASLKEYIKEVFDIAGFTSIFKVFENTETAIKNI